MSSTEPTANEGMRDPNEGMRSAGGATNQGMPTAPNEGMRGGGLAPDQRTRTAGGPPDQGMRSAGGPPDQGMRGTGGPPDRGMRGADDTGSAQGTTAARGATGTMETDAGGRAGSAAERLGGPSEGERTAEAAGRADTDARRDDSSARDQAAGAAQQRATLIAPERAENYNNRWTQIKGQFVDEPRAAVRGANELVGEVLDELEELFRRQRAELEQGLDSEQTSTEDLRQALGRYRSFFDRLLSF
jgi:hypothetical protein